jgi:hypothetical protein
VTPFYSSSQSDSSNDSIISTLPDPTVPPDENLESLPGGPGPIIMVGDWLYSNIRAGRERNDYLYRVSEDGKKKTVLVRKKVYSFYLSDNWLYYTCDEYDLYKMRRDGSENQKIKSFQRAFTFKVYGDLIFIKISNMPLQVMKTDGTDLINLFINVEYSYYHYNGWLYFFLTEPSIGLRIGWHKMEIPPGYPVNRLGIEADYNLYLSKNENYSYKKISEENDYLKQYEIYKFSKDFSTQQLITTIDYLGNLCATDEWIYWYVAHPDSKQIIYRCNKSGGEIQNFYVKIPEQGASSDQHIEYLIPAGSWIYFKLKQNSDWFRCTLDGKDVQKVLW